MSQSIACIGIDCVMDSRKKLRIAEFRVFREGLHRGKHYRRGGPADIQFRRPSSCMCTGERLPMYVPWKLNALFAAIACAYRLEILSFSHTEQAVSIRVRPCCFATVIECSGHIGSLDIESVERGD